MKTCFFTFILFFGLIQNSMGQHRENANWCFGGANGLSFSPNPFMPTTFTAATTFTEATGAVSDAGGSLLFYCNSTTVYDQTHGVMTNGTGLLGQGSSTNGVVIVPRPLSKNYYIFNIVGTTSSFSGLHYSEVDMDGNGGLGEVIAGNKNTPLLDHLGVPIDLTYGNDSEKAAATSHCNQQDYWFVAQVGDFIYSYLVTNAGISATPVSFTPCPVPQAFGQMKISLDSKRIAMAYAPGGLHLADFNNATGQVTFDANPITIPGVSTFYGVEFSPLTKYVYFGAGGDVYRGDAYTATSATVSLVTSSVPGASYRGGMQVAIDGRIYISTKFNIFNISVINNPDDALTPDLQENGITLAFSVDQGLPPFVPWQAACFDNLTLFTPNPNVLPYTYSCSDYITTQGTYTVQPGRKIGMEAGNFVQMDPNSHIQAGSIFHAIIKDCGCESESMPFRMVMAGDAIENEQSSLLIYPNPATDKITIKLQEGKIASVVVTGADGRNVFSRGVEEESVSFDVTSLSTGVYIVNIISSTGDVFVRKIIIE